MEKSEQLSVQIDFQLACFESLSDDDEELPFYAAEKFPTSEKTENREEEAGINQGVDEQECDVPNHGNNFRAFPLQQVSTVQRSRNAQLCDEENDINVPDAAEPTYDDDDDEINVPESVESACDPEIELGVLNQNTQRSTASQPWHLNEDTSNFEDYEIFGSQFSNSSGEDPHRNLDSCHLDHVVPDSSYEE